MRQMAVRTAIISLLASAAILSFAADARAVAIHGDKKSGDCYSNESPRFFHTDIWGRLDANTLRQACGGVDSAGGGASSDTPADLSGSRSAPSSSASGGGGGGGGGSGGGNSPQVSSNAQGASSDRVADAFSSLTLGSDLLPKGSITDDPPKILVVDSPEVSIRSVPLPIAGAGLPGLLFAGALLAWLTTRNTARSAIKA
jgi:hypothetical protein